MNPYRLALGLMLLFHSLGAQGALAQAAEPAREASPALVDPVYRSPERQAISLNGTWEFAIDPEGKGEREAWQQAGVALAEPTTITVPGCWEAQGVGGEGDSTPGATPGAQRLLRGSYVGTAWYRREVAIPPEWAGRQIWLKIGGVHAQGWFWVNGAYVAHSDTYCGAYKYNITDLVAPGRPALVVAKVRNDVASSQGAFSRVQRLGGLTRGVELEATPSVLIDYACVEGDFDGQKARARVRVRSTSPTLAQALCLIDVTVATQKGDRAGSKSGHVVLEGMESKEVDIEVALYPFYAWSPEAPNLYKATIELQTGARAAGVGSPDSEGKREILSYTGGETIDGWVERFGVKKFEARGADFYLNGSRHFVRGYSDDCIYPMTLASSASREEHRRRLGVIRDCGFTFVRTRARCELPEFYEAADELGLMVQAELPYCGVRPVDPIRQQATPREDLRALIAHYRRYVSLSVLCAGTGGSLGSPIDVELYQLARQLDPSRPFLHQAGGRNTPENSDYVAGPSKPWEPGSFAVNTPYLAHEYLDLAVHEDPRLEPRYAGAELAPPTATEMRRALGAARLSWEAGIAIQDAAQRLQSVYQKRWIESARFDQTCDGYILRTATDVGYPLYAEGLLNHFCEPKPAGSAPEFLRQFNAQTVLLIEPTPAERIATQGEPIEALYWISHFGSQPLEDETLNWELTAGGQVLESGRTQRMRAVPGRLGFAGATRLTVPELDKPLKATLSAAIEGTSVRNSWDFWIFPDRGLAPMAGKGAAASPKVFDALASRFASLALLGTTAASGTLTLITDTLDATAIAALEEGKRLLLIGLPGERPGVELGMGRPGPQAGTAVLPGAEAAFGDFPHEGYLGPLFFRLAGTTIEAGARGYESVEPLMAGRGEDNYRIHVFQAQVDGGKILATGLDLLANTPEATCLLDRFLAYIESDAFNPKGTLDVSIVRND